MEAAVRHGMTPLVCIGETLDEREAGRAKEVLNKQVRGALGLLSETQNVNRLANRELVGWRRVCLFANPSQRTFLIGASELVVP